MEHGFYEPVLPHLQRALELDEKLVASGPDDAEAQYVVGRDYSYLADYYTHVSHWHRLYSIINGPLQLTNDCSRLIPRM